MHKLKASELAAWRVKTLEAQGGVCLLCGAPPTTKQPAVADHDHVSGQLRGVLCRGCNSGAGVIENFRARYGLTDIPRFSRFLSRLVPYLYKDHGDVLYPSHRTADEKRILRNKRATLARKARKTS